MLDRLPRGATAISDLSAHLVDGVERAWVWSTLKFHDSQIRTGHVILAVLKTPALRSVLTGMSREFEKVNADQLADDFEQSRVLLDLFRRHPRAAVEVHRRRGEQEAGERQLYQIAELGKPDNEPTRAPRFMRLLVASDQPKIDGDALDFRDEVMAQIFDRGDATPKRTLRFDIEITDDGSTHGPGFSQNVSFSNWRRIGQLTFDNAVASYNGDFVIHFNHPTWRTDRNDPSTATRVNERKVRARERRTF